MDSQGWRLTPSRIILLVAIVVFAIVAYLAPVGPSRMEATAFALFAASFLV